MVNKTDTPKLCPPGYLAVEPDVHILLLVGQFLFLVFSGGDFELLFEGLGKTGVVLIAHFFEYQPWLLGRVPEEIGGQPDLLFNQPFHR